MLDKLKKAYNFSFDIFKHRADVSVLVQLVLEHGGKILEQEKKGDNPNLIYENSVNFANAFLDYFRIDVRVSGLENIIMPPSILCLNHTSAIEPVVLFSDFPGRLVVGAKKELFKIPVFGPAIKALGMIPIDRSNLERSIRSMNYAAGYINKNEAYLVMFPEGTRSPDGNLGNFKDGAFITAASNNFPIIPVAISGVHEILPKKSLDVTPGTVYLNYLEPVYPTGNDKKSAIMMKDATREKIESCLISYHSGYNC